MSFAKPWGKVPTPSRRFGETYGYPGHGHGSNPGTNGTNQLHTAWIVSAFGICIWGMRIGKVKLLKLVLMMDMKWIHWTTYCLLTALKILQVQEVGRKINSFYIMSRIFMGVHHFASVKDIYELIGQIPNRTGSIPGFPKPYEIFFLEERRVSGYDQ